MPRNARVVPGGMLFHVLNRGVGRMRLFLKEADFEAFERNVEKTLETCPMRIVAYCLMSNHWHLVLWPERSGDLGAFMQKLTITHARNWQVLPAPGRLRPPLPRPLQIVSDRGRRTLLPGGAVRGAQRLAAKSGSSGGAMSMSPPGVIRRPTGTERFAQ